MKLPFLCLLSLLSLPALAQDIDPKTVLKDVQVLSEDRFEGRKVGTRGGQLAAAYIIERYKAIGLTPYKDDFRQPFTFKGPGGEPVSGNNLVAVIPGKKPETIVISAHYDHIGVRNGQVFNGADDNASGIGGLLAIAAYYKKHRPGHTLVIAAFDAEESGLQGAKAFVAATATNLPLIRLNINMDMISHSDKHELYVCGSYRNPSLKKYLVTTVPGIKLIPGHDDPKLGRSDDWTDQSDQGAFNARHIPFLYFGVEDHKDYHKATDEYPTITKDFYVAAVKTVLQVIDNYDKSAGR